MFEGLHSARMKKFPFPRASAYACVLSLCLRYVRFRLTRIFNACVCACPCACVASEKIGHAYS